MISPAGVLGTASALVLATVACGGDPDVEVRRPTSPVWCPADIRPEGQPPRPGRQGTFDARRLLGHSEGAATQLARDGGCEMRVVRRNGEPLPGTADFNTRRVNVLVEDETVVAIDGVG